VRGAALVALALVFGIAPAGAQSDQVIHVGAGLFEANAGAYYALDNGFFKAVGLNVEVEPFTGSGPIVAAVASGTLQVGVANPLPLAIASEKGLNFVIIAPGTLFDAKTTPANLMIAPGSTIRSGKDLEGATVAVTTLQGLDPLGVESYIDKTGGDSHRVKIIELPQTLMADAISSGRIAAGTIADPAVTDALNAGKVKALSSCYTYIGNHFFVSAWFASKDWADAHPDLARRFRTAIDRAADWATRNPVAAAAILHKYLKSTVDRARELHAKTIDPSMIQPVIDAAYKYKILDRNMDAHELIWTPPQS
jgi:NitT/TauT family transport system substrate-binding protein